MKDAQRRNSVKFIHRNQDGFSLLEAVFAMMILAFGLLGLAGMQTVALSFNVDAGELTRASNIASEMLERIHSNRVNAGDYNGALGTGLDTANGATTPPTTQPTARGDFLMWQQNVANSGLTNAQGTVNVTSPFGPAALNQSQVVVQVVWLTKANEKKASRQARVTLQTVVTPQ